MEQWDQTKDLVLGAEAIHARGYPRTQTLDGKSNHTPLAGKARNSMDVPGSALPKDLDSQAKSIGDKSKTCNRRLQMRFKRPSTKLKILSSNVMAGKFAPVSDLVKSFQVSEDSSNIMEDQKPIPTKRPTGSKLMPSRKFMTPEGKGMQPIHEHEDEHEDEQSSERSFSPSEFGEDSPDISFSKSAY